MKSAFYELKSYFPLINIYIICVNKNKKEVSTPGYSLRITRGKYCMNRFFNNLEKGYAEALGKNILWFTVGWCLGNIIKVIIESFTDSKDK